MKGIEKIMNVINVNVPLQLNQIVTVIKGFIIKEIIDKKIDAPCLVHVMNLNLINLCLLDFLLHSDTRIL